MNTTKIIFWFSAIIIFYSYLGYGLLLYVLVKIKFFFKPKSLVQQQQISLQPVTLIIPAYNEATFLHTKIENTLTLDYPAHLLKIIFITDGSTDDSPNIVHSYPQLTLLHSPERKGKIAAMNRVMQAVDTPFVIFCDANTLLNSNALQAIMQHYADPRVGGVAGEKRVMTTANTAGQGEGLYWRYESMLKKLDAAFYTIVGAAGELFSFRTHLYTPTEEDTLLDDFMISLRICQKGYRVQYEPNAFAMEAPSANIKEEQKRKIRISAGGFQSMARLKSLLNIFRYPKLSFQYISHRVLRWAVCPFLLPLILLLNIIIVMQQSSIVYAMLLYMQLAFYAFAALGWLLMRFKLKSKWFQFPHYFVFMNLSLYLGLARYMRGNQSVLWEKAKRLD